MVVASYEGNKSRLATCQSKLSNQKNTATLKYLLNPVFLIGLLILAFNDHLFKFEYHNWLTGKLSDFAGILILPFFLKFLFGGSKRAVIAATVLLFTWWKSPWSQPAIDFYNGFSPIGTGRVVDYTDLVAFTVLPLTWYALKYIDRLAFTPRVQQSWVSLLVFPLATLVFVATSDDEIFTFPSSNIESCCGLSSTMLPIGNGTIFTPSAFTPDFDGINDVFFPQTDGNIVRIDTFLIKDVETGVEIFRRENMTDLSNILAGWNGVNQDTIIAATYEFSISVTARDSTRGRHAGYVCALPCQDPIGQPRPENLNECLFSTQFDPMLGYRADIESGEELDCFD